MTTKLFDLSNRLNMFYWQTNRQISPEEQKNIFLDRHHAVKKEEASAAIEYGMQQAGKSRSASKVTHLSDPIDYGSVNSVLKASLQDGTEIVIRMHPHHVINGYFWVEKVATALVKHQGVPTYETYFIYDQRKLFSFDFMIMEALSGSTLQALYPLTKTQDKRQIFETGACLARIHSVKPIGFGFFNNALAKSADILKGQYTTFKDHFYAALVEDLDFLVSHQVVSPSQRESVEKIFAQRESLLRCDNPSLVHNDIADWNQLSDGKIVTGIVDWDECFGGDPVMDFAAWSLFYPDERRKYLISGYKSVAPIPDGFEYKDHLFRLRYLISKMHLRKKRLLVMDSPSLNEKIKRGMSVMQEEFKYFGI